MTISAGEPRNVDTNTNPLDEESTQSHAGRASSWLAVTVMLLGFTVGGIALCLGPHWFVFWVGAGIVALGGILALAFDIFSDVIIDAPRVINAAPHHSPFDHSESPS